jgi:hypothetical protein
MTQGTVMRWSTWRTALAAAALGLAGMAQAASFTVSGQFAQDDQIAWFLLEVDAPGTVQVRSLGYAGGTDSVGQAWPSGGFDTMVFL